MGIRFSQAAAFILSHARLLERLLFAVRFASADPAPVGRLITAYQNDDGGFGHALEPDVRCAESQPLFAETGLLALRDAGIRDSSIALSLCAYLDRVAVDGGLVPILLPSAFQAPRAAHWASAGEPGLNPTAGVCGLLHWHAVEHPWLKRATDTCSRLLLEQPAPDAHDLLCATRLVENMPDRTVADRLADRIAEVLPTARMFVPSAPYEGYGLTPLWFATSPDSRWRSLFTDSQIESHLDYLESAQQEDGGWPISWEALSRATESEWRGRFTLEALATLAAYDRCAP
jgi:hypothetical protein